MHDERLTRLATWAALARPVAGPSAVTEAHVALATFRRLTRHRLEAADPLGPLAEAICAAEHFAVLACVHARHGSSRACAGYALQAIHHESEALGANGPLGTVLVRFLDAIDQVAAAN